MIEKILSGDLIPALAGLAFEKEFLMNINTDKLFKEAEVLKKRKFFNKAEKIIKKILAIKPSCIEAYMLLGDMAYENKNSDNAISFYRKVVKIDKKYFQAWLNLGVCYKNKNLLASAQKAVIQGIKLNPYISHGYEVFAEIMFRKGDIKKSFQAIEIAIKRCQNKYTLYYTLSKILTKKCKQI